MSPVQCPMYWPLPAKVDLLSKKGRVDELYFLMAYMYRMYAVDERSACPWIALNTYLSCNVTFCMAV